MDVLRPPLTWVGRRCYRKPFAGIEGSNPEDDDFTQDYVEESNSSFAYSDESCDADLDITQTDRGFRLKFEVPSSYYKYIIGKKGETKKRLETETRTQILVPKQGDKSEEIVLLGVDRKGIVSAKTRLDLMIDSARQKQPFTHFLSIPVKSEEIYDAFDDFKFQVLNICHGDRGLDHSLFQTREKLHLTLGTLVLLSESEIQQAVQLLEACKESVVEPVLRGKKLDVCVKGLEYMNDDPYAVDVLYAQIEQGDACNILQTLADRLVDVFVRAGFMHQENERVKLHATVMNTLMRKDPSGTSVPRNAAGVKPRESFDASNVLKKFGKFNFGYLSVPLIHLSQRYSTNPNGYYSATSTLDLPTSS